MDNLRLSKIIDDPYKDKLDFLNNKIRTCIEHLSRIRIKRGLINGLGAFIKTITGNLDEDDYTNLNHKFSVTTKVLSSIEDKLERIEKYNLRFSKLAGLTVLNKVNSLEQDIIILYEVCEDILLTLTFARHSILYPVLINSEVILKAVQNIPSTLEYDHDLHEMLTRAKTDVHVTFDTIYLIIEIPTYDTITYDLYTLIPILKPANDICLYPKLPQRQYLKNRTKIYEAHNCYENSCEVKPADECIQASFRDQRYLCETIKTECPDAYEEKYNQTTTYRYFNKLTPYNSKCDNTTTYLKGSFLEVNNCEQSLLMNQPTLWNEDGKIINSEPIEFENDNDKINRALEDLEDDLEENTWDHIWHFTYISPFILILICSIPLLWIFFRRLKKRPTSDLAGESQEMTPIRQEEPPVIIMECGYS